eukprot:3944206-Amphidinium_carterae.1
MKMWMPRIVKSSSRGSYERLLVAGSQMTRDTFCRETIAWACKCHLACRAGGGTSSCKLGVLQYHLACRA